MPTLADLLGQQCPTCNSIMRDGACWYCTKTATKPTDARLRAAARARHAVEDTFRVRFPIAAAVHDSRPRVGFRSEDETYSEGIYDDD